MELGLTRGAVAAISASAEWAHTVARPPPVLQVAGLRLFGGLPGRPTQRYIMTLSDGVRSLQGIVATAMHHLARDGGALRRGAVLRLREYFCITVQNRRRVARLYIKKDKVDKYMAKPWPGAFIFLNFEILQTCAEYCGESHPAGQAIEADLARKQVAQINAENLDCSDTQEFAIVKATLTFINKENFCYTACPLVVNGRQCRMEVSSNGDGWWHCHSCKQTFVTCEYRYRVLFQLQDSTGTTCAPASQQAGEDIFGRTAKELYLMKCGDKQDSAKFDNIVEGVLFHDFLFKLKLKTTTIHGKRFPKCTIVKAGKVNPSTESRRFLREINKLLQENSGSAAAHLTFLGTRAGFSYLGARQRVQNFSRDPYAMNHGDAWDLASHTGSNSL